jgi:hypothetical protein
VIPTMQAIWGDRVIAVSGIVDDNAHKQLLLLCSEAAPGSGVREVYP